MVQTIPTKEPASVVAGDTIQWKRSLPDFLASAGWALNYRLINAAGRIDITSTADGDDHSISVAAADSQGYAPGSYTWTAYVTKDQDRHTIGSGTMVVKPDLAAQTSGYDTRSHAVKTLEAIEAVIEGRATQSHLSYSIMGREMRFIEVSDLLVFRDKYRREVEREKAAERVANGKRPRNRIHVRL